MSIPNRTAARHTALSTLERLRQAFPLEARVTTCTSDVRKSYVTLLARWKDGKIPAHGSVPSAAVDALQALDAVVVGPDGIGCYPFAARDTGITVRWGHPAVYAMCAIDALAVARLVDTKTTINAACEHCGDPVTVKIERDGSLDHDQVNRARVIWTQTARHGDHCSDNLCRAIRFLCPTCGESANFEVLTLPQAAVVANAFFGFQRELLRIAEGDAT